MTDSSIQSRSEGGAGAEHDGFPQVFGKYVLLRPMARGGMGELFVAAAGETGGFEKLCVVKKVLHNLEDAGVHRRFLDEAKVVVRLNHTNLVQVFDAGRVANDYYLAMELVEGKDLRAMWNRCAQLHRRIPVDVAIFVIREVARGLDYVHDAMSLDLVHRDISPPNILVGYHGEVKLTDFGLAKSAIKREMTSPGVVFGRYSYLSPEQARGLPADRRTDIYAAAIVLWELLTGRQLFPSSNRSHQEALAAVRNPVVRPPSEVVPGIPAGLDEVVLRALNKEREKRYSSAGEFRAALSDILARHYPTCDADRVSAFMRDIFARESKLETADYAEYARLDYSDVRAQEISESISISDVITIERGGGGVDSSAIELQDGDIVELDEPGERQWPAKGDADLVGAARDWIGKLVAQRYRIDALLGVGGMGAVFRATHLALGKSYALKILHRIYSRDRVAITRFMREARAATQTGHPNIIDITDIGTLEEGDVYFVMELLEGLNLADAIRSEGPLAIRRALHIGRQICRSLQAAHAVGIIHRDMKSENVQLVARGKDPDFVKVLDFGICKQTEGEGDGYTTTPGIVMGSPDYMSPEQGAGLEAGVASDVYAVGCILFEMLTGQLPYVGSTAIDVLMQKGSQDAPRVTALRPECPDQLADAIARCLQRRPEDRPASMRVLEYDLTRAIDGRASAVAAVLGLNVPNEPAGAGAANDPSSASSASLHRAAVVAAGGEAALSAVRSGSGELGVAGVSMSQAAMPAQAKKKSPVAAGFTALMFVALGVLLMGVLVFALSPETVARIAGDGSQPQDEAGSAGEGQTKAAERGMKSAKAEAKPEPPPRQAEPPAPLPAPDKAVGNSVGDLPVMIARAEQALADRHFTEPAEGSLALELANLSLVDPGHEAISRLRKQAAEMLLPVGEKAIRRKRWKDAADAYRELVNIWPENGTARDQLVEALYRQSRILRRLRDFDGMLAAADELLNLEPENFKFVMTRALALEKLRRWEDAKEAYSAARKLKPRSSDATKGYWNARKMIKRQKRKSKGK